MNSLVFLKHRHPLGGLSREDFLAALRRRLEGRVIEAHVFGSVAAGTFTQESDVDLILVADSKAPFFERAQDFFDLHDLAPRLDLLVYTPDEFAELRRDPQGFWKTAFQEMIRLL